MVSRASWWAVLAGGAVWAGLAGVGACVLADPPAALPTTPIEPPEILREQVLPSAGDFLTTLPTQFVVPVVADPREAQVLSAFSVDGTLVASRLQPVSADGGVLVLVNDPPNILSAECHTLEVSVSYPDSNVGDSVTWFYGPTTSFANCPIFDAGPEAGDAGLEAGD